MTVVRYEENKHELQSLFTVVLQIDRAFRIESASQTLFKHMPGLDEPSMLLTDIFDIRRPAMVHDYESACLRRGELCLMVAKDESFAIRGQFVVFNVAGIERLFFCGSPWLMWMNAHETGVRLTMDDFSAQDVQLDQLFYMSSENRMIEDLEQLNEELQKSKLETTKAQEANSRFFAQMSHEMRTPLNAVISALTLLREKGLPPDSKELVDLAARASKSMIHLTNYVLDIAKLEKGNVKPVRFTVNEVLEAVTNIIKPKAVQENLDVVQEITGIFAPAYNGHYEMLCQSLLNLAINAIKFTPTGTITLRVLKKNEQNGTHVLRFEVEDTGIGIEKNLHSKIFEPFWSSSPREASDKGTGLGLDIVKRNIGLMEGQLGVDSRLGVGSCFWFEVALEPTYAAKSVLDIIECDSPARLAGHVLLVDDNNTNLLLGKMLLESLDLTVTTANSGCKAIEATIKERFDAVLMDINMPEMNGFETTEVIRQQPGNSELPIIALTAYTADDVDREKLASASFAGYMTKPIIRDSLAVLLAPWLKTNEPYEGPVNSGKPDLGESLIDIEVINTLIDQIGAENLHKVLANFDSESASRIQRLQLATEDKDIKSAAREAHTLASTCFSFGLSEVGKSLREIEETTKAELLPDKTELLEISSRLNTSLEALHDFLHLKASPQKIRKEIYGQSDKNRDLFFDI